MIATGISRTVFALIALQFSSAAQTVAGKVQNGTSGKPAPGAQVALIRIIGSQVRDQDHTITAEDGTFQLQPGTYLDPNSANFLRVTHNGVEYSQEVHPGEIANVTVYDASPQVSGVTESLSILQFQTKHTDAQDPHSQDKSLQVTELHAVSNESSPPTTQANPDNMVFRLPPGAQVALATVSGPSGQVVKLPLLPDAKNPDQYSLDFP